MDSFLIRGILIGLLFGVPVGAVGTMTVQRTFLGSFKDGLVTGLGSSVADCLYAIVGAFGLTIVSDFLLKYQMIINILGGIFVLVMGVRVFFTEKEVMSVSKSSINGFRMFFSSFAVGITNPATILTFLFAFSYFGIGKDAVMGQGIKLVAGVFIGTYVWWSTLSAFVCFIKRKIRNPSFQFMNRIFGAILCLFGSAIFIQTFL